LSILFLLPHLASGRWPVIGAAIVAAAVVFLTGVLLFRSGWVGGGDVKLMTALALWAGPGGLLQFALLTSLVGGVVSLACLGCEILRRWRGGGGTSLAQIEVPYGVAIALGGAPLILATF
jgi:prepilin peptidase CpaA